MNTCFMLPSKSNPITNFFSRKVILCITVLLGLLRNEEDKMERSRIHTQVNNRHIEIIDVLDILFPNINLLALREPRFRARIFQEAIPRNHFQTRSMRNHLSNPVKRDEYIKQ